MAIILDTYCVYQHITPSNKSYIGLTHQKPEHRWNGGRGYKQHKYFYAAIKKYGWNNIQHIIIAEGLTKEEACQLEKELIAKFKTTYRQYGYNIGEGGDVGNRGSHLTIEQREAIAERSRGRVKSKEEIEKIRFAHLGKAVSEETKSKLREINLGKKLSDDTKRKISESTKGKCLSEETRNKLRESKKREHLSLETRKKLSESKYKKCICVETGKIFDSIYQASEFCNLSRSSITNALTGRSKSAGGYHWEYYTQETG